MALSPYQRQLEAQKTMKGHRGKRVVGISYRCECGWSSGFWMGQGATANAAGEFLSHKENVLKCRDAAEPT